METFRWLIYLLPHDQRKDLQSWHTGSTCMFKHGLLDHFQPWICHLVHDLHPNFTLCYAYAWYYRQWTVSMGFAMVHLCMKHFSGLLWSYILKPIINMLKNYFFLNTFCLSCQENKNTWWEIYSLSLSSFQLWNNCMTFKGFDTSAAFSKISIWRK